MKKLSYIFAALVLAISASGQPSIGPASVAEVQAGTVRNKFVSPYTLNNPWIKQQGITDPQHKEWANGFANEIARRGRDLNDAWIFPSIWNPTNTLKSYRGVTWSNNATAVTAFGLYFNNNGATNQTARARLYGSFPASNTIVVISRIRTSYADTFGNGSYLPHLATAINTNTLDALTATPYDGYKGNSIYPSTGGTNFAYYGNNGNGNPRTNTYQVVSDNGWMYEKTFQSFRQMLVISSDGVSRLMVGFNGGQASFYNNGTTYLGTLTNTFGFPTNGFNQINLAIDEAFCIGRTNNTYNGEIEAVYVFNGGFDTNIFADAWAITSWLFPNDEAVCWDGDSVMDNNNGTVQTHLDGNARKQLSTAFFESYKKDVLPIIRASGGASFSTLSNLQVVGFVDHKPLYNTPSKFTKKTLFSDLGRNALGTANFANAVTNAGFFTNYYYGPATNGWDVVYVGGQLLGTGCSLYTDAFNTYLAELGQAVARISGGWVKYKPYWQFINQNYMASQSPEQAHMTNRAHFPILAQYLKGGEFPKEQLRTYYATPISVTMTNSMRWTNLFCSRALLSIAATSQNGAGINDLQTPLPSTGGSVSLMFGDVFSITNPVGATASYIHTP